MQPGERGAQERERLAGTGRRLEDAHAARLQAREQGDHQLLLLSIPVTTRGVAGLSFYSNIWLCGLVAGGAALVRHSRWEGKAKLVHLLPRLLGRRRVHRDVGVSDIFLHRSLCCSETGAVFCAAALSAKRTT
eukprot:scaffold84150_cov55-Phaeocystis_antarctica.AAC.2